jgi:hypothetical protein
LAGAIGFASAKFKAKLSTGNLFAPTQFLAQHHATVYIHSMNLKELLGDIQTDRRYAHECPSQDCNAAYRSLLDRDESISLGQFNESYEPNRNMLKPSTMPTPKRT